MVFAVNMNIILNMKAMFAVMNTSKAEVKILIQACMGFESMAFAIPVQCSANWANNNNNNSERVMTCLFRNKKILTDTSLIGLSCDKAGFLIRDISIPFYFRI